MLISNYNFSSLKSLAARRVANDQLNTDELPRELQDYMRDFTIGSLEEPPGKRLKKKKAKKTPSEPENTLPEVFLVGWTKSRKMEIPNAEEMIDFHGEMLEKFDVDDEYVWELFSGCCKKSYQRMQFKFTLLL